MKAFALFSLALFASTLAQDNILQVEIEEVDQNLGFVPPSQDDNDLQDLSGSCTCKQILVSSLGEGQHLQAGKLTLI